MSPQTAVSAQFIVNLFSRLPLLLSTKMVEMVGVPKSTGHETCRKRKIKIRCFVQNTYRLAPARGDVKL